MTQTMTETKTDVRITDAAAVELGRFFEQDQFQGKAVRITFQGFG